jgi:(1->4)-alpha-D-glucan 1-alpha-D-glucosylmutase
VDVSAAESSAEGSARAIIPRATYRLQLNGAFTLRHATALIPYLARLGISHVYCSPYFRARPGSTHGYDVVDHNALNPEIANATDFERFVTTLRAHGMGQILDVVPNHVGIMGSDNAWWMDVLENGAASLYAAFFDIDWQPANPALAGKLLVPVLGESYGRVLERRELEPRFERAAGAFAIYYHTHRFPLDPRSYPRILEPARKLMNPGALAPEARAEFESLIAAFGHLPERNDASLAAAAERNRDKEVHKRRLAAMCASHPLISEAIDRVVAALRGDPAAAAGSDALHELLEAQAYRLASWRVASDEINYRRFFDVNDLAALRMENETVLENTHRLTLQLLRSGKLDGLRIDHPDGLYDPEQYFRRLQSRAAGATATAGAHSGELPLYLIVEKVTASFERLPSTWPVHGTTGYNFMNVVNGLFIDPSAKSRLTRTYHAFIGEPAEWKEIAYDAKRLILDTALSSELTVLTNQLARIARADRNTRDFTFRSLRQALTDIIACFPVYRTYVTDSVSAEDRRFIDWAVARAKGRDAGTNYEIYEFVRTALLIEVATANETARERVRAFAMKFQQLTAPVTAKGVEDTALYRFHRLVALNEVGSDPDAFGVSVRAFHADAKYRQKHWPHEMLATSTHDTKRSEDTRARIDVLSEMPSLWRQMLARWRRMNRLRKRDIEGRPAPGPNQEYLLYQILLGSWPLEVMDAASLHEYSQRIAVYMIKASREAKSRTSWSDRSKDYEDALTQFVHTLLEPRDGNLFLQDIKLAQQRIARFGVLNSLSQTLCKLTAPGVPDVYQGNDILDFSLVDPDNRRAVDYEQRARMLAALEAHGKADPEFARALLLNMSDGRAKLYLTWRALQYRKARAALFRDGAYLPAAVTGEHASHLCAYARRLENDSVLVIIPRLYARLMGEREELPLGEAVWADTAIELPRRFGAASLHNILDGSVIAPETRADGHFLAASAALANFPVALLAASSS